MESPLNKQRVLMFPDELYLYLKVMSILENVSMSEVVTVLVKADMLKNEKIVAQFKDIIFKKTV